MIKFTTTQESSLRHGIKALVYGRSGAGKTYMARTAPTPIIISAEAGVLSLRDVNIPVIKIENIDDLTNTYQWLTKDEKAKEFRTVYIDSITEIAEVVLSNAKRTTRDPRQAYGEMIEKMTILIRSFRDLEGKHVVMLAKQESFVDDISKVTMYGPSMPGTKLGNQIPYLFDEVFRLGIGKDANTGEDFRYLQTRSDLQYDCKDRSGALDPIEPANLTQVFNKILTLTESE